MTTQTPIPNPSELDWHAVTSPLDNVATMELHEENDA